MRATTLLALERSSLEAGILHLRVLEFEHTQAVEVEHGAE